MQHSCSFKKNHFICIYIYIYIFYVFLWLSTPSFNVLHCIPTIKHCSAELGGGGQREASVVELVAVVADADLKLNGIIHVLQQRGRVEGHKQGELPLPEKLLLAGKEA